MVLAILRVSGFFTMRQYPPAPNLKTRVLMFCVATLGSFGTLSFIFLCAAISTAHAGGSL
jgi:hypothetical protein